MKLAIIGLALLTASIAVPANAEDLGAYRNYGACVAAWSTIDKDFWDAGKADGSLDNRGNTYPSPVGCVKIGDWWHLVTVDR